MQLTKLATLSKENIIFHEVKEYKIKQSKFKYNQIKIEVRYSYQKKGPLVTETPFLFSFGVNEKKNQETDKLVGYFIPICLWEKDGQPNPEEANLMD